MATGDCETFNIEVGLKKNISEQVHDELLSYILDNFSTMSNNAALDFCDNIKKNFEQYVEAITMDEMKKNLCKENVVLYFYEFNSKNAEIEILENTAEGIAAANHWILPSHEFLGLWESLMIEDEVKDELLKFVETMIEFSFKKINQSIITCNRIILLHGPPGTGKTSLCQALSQKIAIRIKKRFLYTHLVEINTHSLFSKWFSESGKLVLELFAKIRDVIDHPQSFVCVLVDEIESLAYSRSSVSDGEPRDAIRVVNTLLTQLDQIRKYPNVLILTTSNLTSTIDCAFLDRADIKQYIGYPSFKAIHKIYISMIQELFKLGIIKPEPISCFEQTEINIQLEENHKNCILHELCEQSIGLSGRFLRKIPLLAHALFLKEKPGTLAQFIEAMQLTIARQLKNDAKITENLI